MHWRLLYRFIFYPSLRFLFSVLAFFIPKIREGLLLRKKTGGKAPWLSEKKLKKTIWIHCASGEFEYAKPLIRKIKKETDCSVLVTYFSPSSKNSISNYPGVDFSSPTPWDSPNVLKEFLEFHKPLSLVVARTDFWPEMLWQTSQKNIPIFLLSGTIVSSSGRFNPWTRGFYQSLLRGFSHISCATNEDQKLFEKLCPSLKDRISTDGDARFDQVFHRLEFETSTKLDSKIFSKIHRDDLFLCGSTWQEDENVIFEAFSELPLSKKIVIAPHEPSEAHIQKLAARCHEIDRSVQIYSKLKNSGELFSSDILIIDEVGLLADLYPLSSLAFVGGSYRKTVHSVMEPLAAGCLTLLGPKHLNNREALAFQKIRLDDFWFAVNVAEEVDSFKNFLTQWSAEKNISALLKVIETQARKKTGATSRFYENHLLLVMTSS